GFARGGGKRLVLVVWSGTQLGQRRRVRRVLPEAVDRGVSRAGSGSPRRSGRANQTPAGTRAHPAAIDLSLRESGRSRIHLFRMAGRGAVFRRPPQQRNAWPTASAARTALWIR